MRTLDIIRKYLDLQEGNALVLLPSDGSGPIELINGNEETTDMDIDICKESIRIIMDTLVVDYIKLPVGTKYIIHDDTIIPIKKVYEVDSDEHCIATYDEPQKIVRKEDKCIKQWLELIEKSIKI